MASGTKFSFPGSTASAGQVALDRFAEMMIDWMEQMKSSDWKQGWIGLAEPTAMPDSPRMSAAEITPAQIPSSYSSTPLKRVISFLSTLPSIRHTISRRTSSKERNPFLWSIGI